MDRHAEKTKEEAAETVEWYAEKENNRIVPLFTGPSKPTEGLFFANYFPAIW